MGCSITVEELENSCGRNVDEMWRRIEATISKDQNFQSNNPVIPRRLMKPFPAITSTVDNRDELVKYYPSTIMDENGAIRKHEH